MRQAARPTVHSRISMMRDVMVDAQELNDKEGVSRNRGKTGRNLEKPKSRDWGSGVQISLLRPINQKVSSRARAAILAISSDLERQAWVEAARSGATV
jgi:hypothetical protein